MNDSLPRAVFQILAICAVSFALQAEVFAAEYRVAADHSGDFTTITQAVSAMRAGDVCIVEPGNYPERIVLPERLSGSASAKTIFRAEPAHGATMRGFDTDGTDYIRIEGFQITNNYTGGLEASGVMIRSSHVEIINNRFSNIQGAAICGYWNQPWSNNVWVKDNYVYHSQKGINICGDNWLVENNTVERLYNYTKSDCDYTRFFGENIIIRGNHFFGTLKSEIGSAHVDGFQTYDNNGEYARDVVIDGNRISECHQGMMANANYHHNSSGFTIINNVFRNCWSWGLDIHGIQNVDVVHNVFANMDINGVGLRSGASGTVYNNIFYNGGTNYWAESDVTMESGSNLLYKPGATLDIRKFTGDLVNQDPKFISSSSGDFHLLEGSPAIDAGYNAGVTQDLEGHERPCGSGVDIGPYEFHGDEEPQSAASAWTSYR